MVVVEVPRRAAAARRRAADVEQRARRAVRSALRLAWELEWELAACGARQTARDGGTDVSACCPLFGAAGCGDGVVGRCWTVSELRGGVERAERDARARVSERHLRQRDDCARRHAVKVAAKGARQPRSAPREEHRRGDGRGEGEVLFFDDGVRRHDGDEGGGGEVEAEGPVTVHGETEAEARNGDDDGPWGHGDMALNTNTDKKDSKQEGRQHEVDHNEGAEEVGVDTTDGEQVKLNGEEKETSKDMCGARLERAKEEDVRASGEAEEELREKGEERKELEG
eukprot:gene48999-65761_t